MASAVIILSGSNDMQLNHNHTMPPMLLGGGDGRRELKAARAELHRVAAGPGHGWCGRTAGVRRPDAAGRAGPAQLRFAHRRGTSTGDSWRCYHLQMQRPLLHSFPLFRLGEPQLIGTVDVFLHSEGRRGEAAPGGRACGHAGCGREGLQSSVQQDRDVHHRGFCDRWRVVLWAAVSLQKPSLHAVHLQCERSREVTRSAT